MSKRSPLYVPPYPARPHASGQARIRLGGRELYLGAWGSPESHHRYRQAVAAHLAGEPPETEHADSGQGLTIREAVTLYIHHARGYYVKGGKPTSQLARIKLSLEAINSLYGDTPAGEFSPLRLKAVRQKMIDDGLCRRHINHRVGCIVRAWKWLVGEEIVPAANWTALRAVDGLRAGRCAAPEGKPVLPVPEADVNAVLPWLSPVVAAMVQLQLFTAARPGEICQLRPCDVDRDTLPGLWVYRPASWKTEHHDNGRERIILIGSRGQSILAPWLLRSPETYCFSPREAMGKRLTASRRSRPIGERYTTGAYAHAITAGCKRAGVNHWHPHRLRHGAATKITAEHGIEIARVLLGHSSIDVTRLYAERDLEAAAKAARQAG